MSVTKVIVLLDEDAIAMLEKLAQDRDTNKTTVIHQAIATEVFLHRARKNGTKIFGKNASGQLREIVWR